MKITEIAECYLGKSNIAEISPLSGGNINKSFMVKSSKRTYILQKVNTEVFGDPYSMMANAIKICNHLRNKKIKTLSYIKKNVIDESGESYLLADKETRSFWRCMKYIKNSGCVDYAENCNYAELTGYAFGKFIKDCSDLTEELTPTIPDFHNLPKRIDKLKSTHDSACAGDKNSVEKAEKAYRKLFSLLEHVNCNLRNDLPDRITHNDTKIANLLFTEDDIIVIDLDTVMPGKITDDFGDSARSVASTAGEDEKDLNKVLFDIEKFRSFSSGFSVGVKKLPSKKEINALAAAPAYVTAELSCRFLTDYYEGNVYFKTSYPEHNLDRAFNQTALLENIIYKQEQINEIVNYCFNRLTL